MRPLKRFLDILGSVSLLVLLSPLMLILACLIRLLLGSPVVFSQRRPGRDCRIFTMYKFRTMTNEKDKSGKLLSDNLRLPPFGRVLRSTSLDELPELVNILKGEMSFVGPRPQLIKDMVFFDSEVKKRQSVVPGLTGWAQVNGRNLISWEQKFTYDLEYVNNQTIRFDLKILFLTIGKVFLREGVQAEDMETAEDYGDYLLRTRKISKEFYDQKMKEAEQI